MEAQTRKSPCYDCIRSDENKNECAPSCERLKEYQKTLSSSPYEDLKGSVFQIYTSSVIQGSIRIHT